MGAACEEAERERSWNSVNTADPDHGFSSFNESTNAN